MNRGRWTARSPTSSSHHRRAALQALASDVTTATLTAAGASCDPRTPTPHGSLPLCQTCHAHCARLKPFRAEKCQKCTFYRLNVETSTAIPVIFVIIVISAAVEVRESCVKLLFPTVVEDIHMLGCFTYLLEFIAWI